MQGGLKPRPRPSMRTVGRILWRPSSLDPQTTTRLSRRVSQLSGSHGEWTMGDDFVRQVVLGVLRVLGFLQRLWLCVLRAPIDHSMVFLVHAYMHLDHYYSITEWLLLLYFVRLIYGMLRLLPAWKNRSVYGTYLFFCECVAFFIIFGTFATPFLNAVHRIIRKFVNVLGYEMPVVRYSILPSFAPSPSPQTWARVESVYFTRRDVMNVRLWWGRGAIHVPQLQLPGYDEISARVEVLGDSDDTDKGGDHSEPSQLPPPDADPEHDDLNGNNGEATNGDDLWCWDLYVAAILLIVWYRHPWLYNFLVACAAAGTGIAGMLLYTIVALPAEDLAEYFSEVYADDQQINAALRGCAGALQAFTALVAACVTVSSLVICVVVPMIQDALLFDVVYTTLYVARHGLASLRALVTTHTLHVVHSQLNGANGSVTGTDDHDNAERKRNHKQQHTQRFISNRKDREKLPKDLQEIASKTERNLILMQHEESERALLASRAPPPEPAKPVDPLQVNRELYQDTKEPAWVYLSLPRLQIYSLIMSVVTFWLYLMVVAPNPRPHARRQLVKRGFAVTLTVLRWLSRCAPRVYWRFVVLLRRAVRLVRIYGQTADAEFRGRRLAVSPIYSWANAWMTTGVDLTAAHMYMYTHKSRVEIAPCVLEHLTTYMSYITPTQHSLLTILNALNTSAIWQKVLTEDEKTAHALYYLNLCQHQCAVGKSTPAGPRVHA